MTPSPHSPRPANEEATAGAPAPASHASDVLTPRRRLALVTISLAVALVIADGTVVNVVIPDIVADLAATSTQVQWIQEAYTLVFAALLLVFGVLADRVGRRRTLVAGLVVFAGASLAAQLAPTPDALVATRVAQGVGGAMILPTTLSLINAGYTGRARGIAFAVWGSTIGGMAAVGPLLGGWLATAVGWRWAFGINPPVCVVLVVATLALVDESRSPRPRSVDPVGAALSVIGLAALTFGLIEGRTLGWWWSMGAFTIGGWTWPLAISPVPVALAVAVASLAGLARWALVRARAGRDALIDVRLYRIPSFRDGSIVAAIVSMGEFGIILALPIWLQNVRGLTALQTGWLIVVLAAGSFASSGVAATLGRRMRAVTVVRLGLVAEIAGVGGVGVAVWLGPGWGWLVPALFVYGVGVGLATAQLTGVVLQDVPREDSGAASGAQSTARQLGSALGIAVLGTVLYATAGSVTADAIADAGTPPAQASVLAQAIVDSSGGLIAGLDADGQTAAADAGRAGFTAGTRDAAFAAAGALVVGLAATATLGRRREEAG